MEIKIKKLNKDVELPKYAKDGDAGMDLVVDNFKKYVIHRLATTYEKMSFGVNDTQVTLFPHDRLLIGCGFSIAIPKGYELQIRSRSGNALNKGLVVLNSPGTIDSGYRGEVGVILINNGGKEVIINIGDKVAQGVLAKYETAEFQIVDELSETERGEGGFGHTDTKK